jgi:fatty-acid desaturase
MKDQAPQSKYRIHYSNLFWISLVHVGALAAIPFYNFANLMTVIVGVFLLAPLAINLGFHRLIAHRAFKAPQWFTRFVATFGAMMGGGAPIHWAASHRIHHQFSDNDGDPHDSRKGFWYAHVLHLFETTEEESGGDNIKKYASDLLADPYMVWLNDKWMWFALAALPVFYFMGGWSMVLWGGFMRLTVMWHVMWLVNSATHMWGYRSYNSKDNTRNNWWVGILAAGEGWHNNHHAFPSCAAHGRKWYEVDLTYYMICILEKLGIAKNVKHPVEPKLTQSSPQQKVA